MKRSFIREILEHTSSDTISFAGGLPDASLFPSTQLQHATQTALEDNSIWQYSTSTGYAPLKALIAKMYSDKGFPTTAEEILITSGSQQGLDIICRYHSGASMSIESPSYLGA
ncbi:PLP-dependent aminotransferase family protein, partial [Sulfurovum lithotrophicum]